MQHLDQPDQVREPELMEVGRFGAMLRATRIFMNWPSAEDREFIDHMTCNYLDLVDDHGVGSTQALEFRAGLSRLPSGIRKELVRLCDQVDRRPNARLATDE